MRSLDIFRDLQELSRAGNISDELRGRIFVPIFWAMAGLVALGLLLSGALSAASLFSRIIQVLTVAFFVVTWLVQASGRHRLASQMLIGGTWLLTSLVAISEGGQANHWLVLPFLLVVLARFLLTGDSAIALGLATAVLDSIVFAFELQRFLPMEWRELALGNNGAAIAVDFLLLVLIFYVADTVLREMLHQTRLTEGRYRSLFDSTNDAVFLIDPQMRCIDANQRAADLLGYTRGELTGKSILDLVARDEVNSERNNFSRLEKEGSLPLFERTLVRADGSRRTAEVSVTAVAGDDGTTRYFQSVVRDITKRKRLEEQLRLSLGEMEVLAMQDALTGLLNRRAITDHADAEWHRAKRERRPMCIVLIDLDNLKFVNDSAGHLAGDQVIVKLATTVRQSLRPYDWAGRWGGDEFMLVLPGSNLVEAREVGERLRIQFSSSELIRGLHSGRPPYLSVGVACYSGRPGDEISLNQLFGQADKALYRAKESGRNRVEVYRDEI